MASAEQLFAQHHLFSHRRPFAQLGTMLMAFMTGSVPSNWIVLVTEPAELVATGLPPVFIVPDVANVSSVLPQLASSTKKSATELTNT
jgi:hypothetical protein